MRIHRPPRRMDLSGQRVLTVPESWAAAGACVVPVEASPAEALAVWSAFDEPTSGATVEERERRLAFVRSTCASCPVLEACREFGTGMQFGFFGGLTPEERWARARGDGRPHEELMAGQRRRERELRRRAHHDWQAPLDAVTAC